jgi:4-diphosphocytidyl-2-C-methyl-D-erythritol kinase
MLMRRAESALRVWTPAKVNLFLEVLARRSDGYHELATLMTAVSLYDTLEFTEGPPGATALHCDHPSLSTGPENLVCRAVELTRRHSGRSDGVAIRLWKRIPMAAGLAGGSSDAAATLAGLNRLWRLGWERARLAELGAELGSDVAFFLTSPPQPSPTRGEGEESPPPLGGRVGVGGGLAAWCTGRGERVERLRLGRTLDFVLVTPPVGLSTVEVFRGVTVPSEPQSGAAIRQAATEGDVSELGRRLHNRLQPAAERLCPAVAELMARLAGLGPAGQLMTGSGSTVIALCRSPSEALTVARALYSARDELGGARVCVVRSCD